MVSASLHVTSLTLGPSHESKTSRGSNQQPRWGPKNIKLANTPPSLRFYVNSYTRKSQWDPRTAPAPRPDDLDGPDGPPPSYTPGKNPTAASDTKSAAGTTNPFVVSMTGASSSSTQQEEEDARLARQMQEEENARGHSPQPGSGAAASYASTPVPGGGSYGSDPQLPP